jgi:hypothetical protein
MDSIFTDKDYNSNDGMITYVWGPPLWHTLHTISFNYPVNPTQDEIEHYYNFYANLENILPCGICRKNIKKNLKKVPLTKDTLKNRYTLSKWVYDFHEVVNEMLGKKSKLSYEDVRDRYESFRARCLLNPKDRIGKSKKKLEGGCIEPLYGIKSKCVLNIVPQDKRLKSINIDSRCKLKK